MICYKCKLDLPDGDFSKNCWKSSGLHNQCKKCQKVYKDNHYKNNKESYAKNRANRRKRQRELLWELKRKLGCHFCKENEPICLDFHHKNPEDKTGLISKMILEASLEKTMKEIEKCILVCANCHRKIHAGLITH